MPSSVSFHSSLHTTHVFGDVIDEEGFCHIESRSLLWWTPDEEREIGRAYEAVVYLMETGQHKEEDDLAESSRGLEKRTEQGAWDLYATQRDFRNAVLCEQDRLIGRGVTDKRVIEERLAEACRNLSQHSHASAHRLALADASCVEAYIRDPVKSSGRVYEALGSSETRTSPLKSPARGNVVPWVRVLSMPLTDTIKRKAIKASVEATPVDKEAMTQAAKAALEGRQKADIKSKTTVKTKKKKKSKECNNNDAKIKKPKKTKKKATLATDKPDPSVLEEEIRNLEKQVAEKEAKKARQLAEKMSFGFDTAKAEKVEKKASKKTTPATVQDEPLPPSRRASIKKVKSSKRKSKLSKKLGSSLSDLNTSSDLSSLPPVSESSASSFDGAEEIFIKEVKSVATGSRRQMSLFPKLRKKLGRKYEDVEEKASCHF